MKNIIFVFSLVAFCSCNDSGDKEVHTVAKNEKSAVSADPILTSGCYKMIIGRDTAEMKLTVNGNRVAGDLQYKRFEKDASFGKFSGTLDDSLIRAGYTFESEGVKSFREVMYKVEAGGLAEGYGDIEMSNDSAWFKYPQALKFEHDHPFRKVECK